MNVKANKAKAKAKEMKNYHPKIRKDDLVCVIAGREKGKSGKVSSVLLDKNRVVVEKLMMVKRHTKANKQNQQEPGGVIEKEGSIHISNVMLLCGKCNKPTRIGFIYLENGQKARICRKCQEVIM